MPDTLEIVNVQLSSPKLTEPDVERGERRAEVDVAVTIRNNSTSILYAVSSIRTLRYDPATRTLFLGLSEPAPSATMPPLRRFPPEETAILPGETKVLTKSVPLVIKRIGPSGRLTPAVDVFDISDVEHVTCRISYGETPFRTVPTESPDEMIKRLQEWSKTTEQTFARRLPKERRSAKAPTPRERR